MILTDIDVRLHQSLIYGDEMYLSFREEFDLPISMVFPYFESPSEWGKLYGIVKPSKVLKNGWHAIPLKRFPFPLVAKKSVFIQETAKQSWRDLSTSKPMGFGSSLHYSKNTSWKKNSRESGI